QHQTAAVFGQSKRLTLAPPCEDALTILIIAALKKSLAYTKGSKMLLGKDVEKVIPQVWSGVIAGNENDREMDGPMQ
ncbi:hypothetical protein KIL84_014756, partial [Mauremys mutica]